jgi:hypothetical protein
MKKCMARRRTETSQGFGSMCSIYEEVHLKEKNFSASAYYGLSGVTVVPPLTSIHNKRIRPPLCLCRLAALSMHDLYLLQDQFPGVSVPTQPTPASNTHFSHHLQLQNNSLLALQRKSFLL